MKRELFIQNQIRRHFKKRGWITVHTPGSIYGNRGFPDLMLFKDGRACFLEVKRGTHYTATPGQLVWIKKLQDAGFTAGVVTSVWDARYLVEEEEAGNVPQ